ncbi:hypothetical protein FXO37_04949 [Capsicum annuum]|nr:hypothetical protein FXO37_04949 [Capsicum annuum]
MAGTINCFLAGFKTNLWFVDTGASNHMVLSMDLLSSKFPLSPSDKHQVHLPIGDSTRITYKGTCLLGKDQLFQDVLYIPFFKFNLLSVSKLTKDLHCFVSFYPDFFLLQDLYTRKVKRIGKEKDSLYLLYTKSLSPAGSQSSTIFLSSQLNSKSSVWHQRLGHTPVHVLNQIPSIKHTLDNFLICNCPICPVAKQTRVPFLIHKTMSTHAFQLVHMDRKYTLELIPEWGLAGAKPAITPLEQHMKFTAVEFDKHLRKEESENPQLVDKGAKSLSGSSYYFLCLLSIFTLDAIEAINAISGGLDIPAATIGVDGPSSIRVRPLAGITSASYLTAGGETTV